MTPSATWWRGAVVYQVYLRSFADGNGDGLGDLAGLRSRLPYLVDLGVDAIWINPWYPSPMVDAGYDVSDYRSVDPRFGSLADAEALLAEAHQAGLRVLLDIVPNHTSDQHPWFQAALAAGPGSTERQRYLFRPGRGPGGEEPPNDWASVATSPAWTRVTEPDGRPGEWYLHLFTPEQPDLDWTHPEVRADFEKTLGFWFDRGVDGFRIDVAHSLAKQEGLPDLAGGLGGHPAWDRDEVHQIYREWRAIADAYPEPRVFVAEAWVDQPERLARYVRPDELHTAFNFSFLTSPWRAPSLRQAIDETLVEHAAVRAPPTWVLSNHDTARHLSRYARQPTSERGVNLHHLLGGRPTSPSAPAGPGRPPCCCSPCPAAPMSTRARSWGCPRSRTPRRGPGRPGVGAVGRTDRGRDGCRVPIPWEGGGPPYGFSPPADRPALAAAAARLGRPGRRGPVRGPRIDAGALPGRPGPAPRPSRPGRRGPALAGGARRGAGLRPRPRLRLPGQRLRPAGPAARRAAPLLASGPLTPEGAVPEDTAVWLRR